MKLSAYHKAKGHTVEWWNAKGRYDLVYKSRVFTDTYSCLLYTSLSAVQEDVKILRDVRHWLNQVLPSEQYRQTAEPGKKPSIQQAVKGRVQRIREEQAEKRQQPRTEKKQDMEL